MVVLATLATIIASQAAITGSFSVAVDNTAPTVTARFSQVRDAVRFDIEFLFISLRALACLTTVS